MDKEKILLIEVNEIFNQITGKEINLDILTQKKQIQEWDSIFHLSLIVDLECKYGVSFSIAEIESLDSIKKIIDKLNIK